MKQLLAFILLILSFPAYAQAQTDDTDANTDRDPAIPMFVQVGKVPYHGDSIPNVVYPPLYKYPRSNSRTKRNAPDSTAWWPT